MKKRTRTKVLRQVNPAKKAELRYRRELNKLIDSMFEIKAPTANNDASIREEVLEMIDLLSNKLDNIDVIADEVVSGVVDESNRVNEYRFKQQMKREMGIDVAKILENNKAVGSKVRKMRRENIALVKTIPQRYLRSLEAIVDKHTLQGSETSMIEDIQKLQNVTRNRAKFIARDQTSKFNNSLSQARQEAVGIQEYIWITAKDERVRPTAARRRQPSYSPKDPNHREKHGKTFRWDTPPDDTGHPGNDFNCRCVAKGVLNI